MGSSCFSRGNRQTLQIIQKYLKDHHLEREIFLRGNHCFGDCSAGPVLKIGNKVYEEVSSGNILEILDKEFSDL